MQENIKTLLESKIRKDLYAKLTAELSDAMSLRPGLIGKIKSLVSRGQQGVRLTQHAAELGLLLIDALPAYKEDKWQYSRTVTYKSKRYSHIEELLGPDEWNDGENYRLLEYFFGEEKAAYALYAWEHIRYQMYQTGYARRSFRSPNNREMYLRNQINFIADLIPQSHNYTTAYSPEYKQVYTFYDLNVVEQIRYAHAIANENPALFMLWSAALDKGNAAVFKQAEDIIFNKDEDGKVTRSLIKALLNSEKKEAWELVEKLLLAAQRQEGLRQTILESLDETSIGALKYMIKVIIDHKLARFSSVVRSVDVWAGLGWESEREATVKIFLEKASKYLENPDEIPEAVKSENNADVYMALWAQGVYDVEKALPDLKELYKNGNAEKRALALVFAHATGHYQITMPLYYPALGDIELQPLACASNFIYEVLQYGENDKYYNLHYPELFDLLHVTYKRVVVKEKTFESFLFSWLKIKFERKKLLLAMLKLVNNQQRLETVLEYFDGMDADAKRSLSHIILPEYSGYDYKEDKGSKTLTTFQRNYAVLILKDRSEYEIAFRALNNVPFTAEESLIFPDLLKRKAAGFRSKIIGLITKQKDVIIASLLEPVLLQGDVEQRLAGLDILLQLQKQQRLLKETGKFVAAFKERKKVSQKEEILLSQLVGSEEAIDLSEKNGYGLYNLPNMSAIVSPKIDSTSLYEKLYKKNDFAFSMPYTHIKKALNDLSKLYGEHYDYEYEIENWDNSKEKVLLGNSFRRKNWKKEYANKEETYNDYPLPEVWQKWYTTSGLKPHDLLIICLSFLHDNKVKQLPDYKDFTPSSHQIRWAHNNPFYEIPHALSLVNPFPEKNEFLIGATTRLFASLDNDTFKIKLERNYYPKRDEGWQDIQHLKVFINEINHTTVDDSFMQDVWNLYKWRQYSGLHECIQSNMPPLLIFCRAFKLGIISEDEMYRGLMDINSLSLLTSKKTHANDYPYFKEFFFLEPMLERVRDYILDIELKRGDSDTPLTILASNLQSIFGVKRLAQILAGLGKTSLFRGYLYSYSNQGQNKQELFSSLLKCCQPLPTDTQELFEENMRHLKVAETRLVEASVYAPQWQRFASNYLGWKGLDSAIWWMHAHTKTDGYRAQNAEAESEIAKYSAVDLQDFQDGAVDKEWFLKAYKEIGKERWSIVYDAAKYISDGNGHRRARIYADVLLGELNLKEVTEKIISKRDQDYVRIYGLAPLSKRNPSKDVLARYEFLEQFKKESRQFGAQKQSSEALALRVAMENLARNAGYPDPIRLTWAMETKQVQEILSKETQVRYDDVLIGLFIDDEGQADVVAFKEDKELKAIPAKYKKDSKVLELLNYRKILREQFKRSRKGLEDAMVRGDVFLVGEIKNLFTHPVIKKHVEKLVFIVHQDESKKAKHGFYHQNKLVSAANVEIELPEDDSLRIAHCTDLYKTGEWPLYQHYAFDRMMQQPFKQIFRELYLPTPDELQEGSVSRRYAGHQVQPKQTVALLRSRGWKVDYEQGLQKVFHKQHFVVKMYAMADWFSPAEIESPTLETIEFHDLKTWKNIEFISINERIFSEVMRDIDLVVSVAHVGGVDPEASHSSIEMRTVLLKETMRLFKVDNVEITGSHATIKGKLGEYSIHLGSAVVHKIAAGYLSILPVHSQHRGRLFLPFIDDDPKSAEVISKVLLLARDNEIKDPTILRQLS